MSCSAGYNRKCAVPSPVQTRLPRPWRLRNVWPPKRTRSRQRMIRRKTSPATRLRSLAAFVDTAIAKATSSAPCAALPLPIQGSQEFPGRIVHRRALSRFHATHFSITIPKPGRRPPGLQARKRITTIIIITTTIFLAGKRWRRGRLRIQFGRMLGVTCGRRLRYVAT